MQPVAFLLRWHHSSLEELQLVQLHHPLGVVVRSIEGATTYGKGSCLLLWVVVAVLIPPTPTPLLLLPWIRLFVVFVDGSGIANTSSCNRNKEYFLTHNILDRHGP